MDYRTLGRTGIRVSVVSFGAGPISGLMTGEDEAGQRATVRRAVEQGINWFDTAATYGDGRSEEALGRALADLPPGASFHVATKVRFGDDDVADFAGAARRSLEGSLRRLGLSRVTLLQLHNSITPGRGDLHTSLTPADVLGPRGVLPAFDTLRREGLVAHLGLTGLGDARSLAMVVREGDFATVQAAFNVLNPSAGRRMPAGFAESDLENLFGQCHESDMGVFAIRVFAGGALAGQPPSPHTHKTKFFPLDLYQRDQQRADYLQRILPDLLSPRELALRFVLAHPHVTSALVGMADAMQVDEAVRHAAAGALPGEVLSAVESARDAWDA
jgi:aryl-alcohol dehydrogenase-like predicted oxidoreductase